MFKNVPFISHVFFFLIEDNGELMIYIRVIKEVKNEVNSSVTPFLEKVYCNRMCSKLINFLFISHVFLL